MKIASCYLCGSRPEIECEEPRCQCVLQCRNRLCRSSIIAVGLTDADAAAFWNAANENRRMANAGGE